MSHRIVPVEPTEKMVERAAMDMLNARGFGFTTTPEDGQDLYDISCQAREEARAALSAVAAAPPYVITDADVERAALAVSDEDCNTSPDTCPVSLCMCRRQARAALEAFVKGLEG